MSAEINKQIQSILRSLLKADNNILMVVLSDRTGLTIARVSQLLLGDAMKGQDFIGAIATAVFTAAAEQGSALQLGQLGILVAEFETGKILTAQSGNGILTVVTTDEATLGVVRMRMLDAAAKLVEILDQYHPKRVLPKKDESRSLVDALKELDF